MHAPAPRPGRPANRRPDPDHRRDRTATEDLTGVAGFVTTGHPASVASRAEPRGLPAVPGPAERTIGARLLQAPARQPNHPSGRPERPPPDSAPPPPTPRP